MQPGEARIKSRVTQSKQARSKQMGRGARAHGPERWRAKWSEPRLALKEKNNP